MEGCVRVERRCELGWFERVWYVMGEMCYVSCVGM